MRDFISDYSGLGSTKAIVACTMGYAKWQSGYSKCTYSVVATLEYKEPVEKCDKKPRHSSFEPYLE